VLWGTRKKGAALGRQGDSCNWQTRKDEKLSGGKKECFQSTGF